jgi:hypothetical protein
MKAISLYLLIFTASLFAQQITIEEKIMKYCEDKWGVDHYMVNYEYEKQTEALIELQEISNKSKEIDGEKEIKNMIKKATSKYWKKDYGIPDYPMVVYECNEQLNAVIKISEYHEKYKWGTVEHNILYNAIGKYHVPEFDTYSK